MKDIILLISNHLRQKIFLIFILALFAFVYVMVFAPPKTQALPAFDQNSPRSQQIISTSSPFEMPLNMTAGYPIGVTLYFEQPKYVNTDQYIINIMDSTGKIVFTNIFSASSLAKDKDAYKLEFGLTNMPKTGGEYILQITAEAIPNENAVSIYTRQSAGAAVPEANIIYSRGISPYVLSFSFITVLAGCILILFYNKKLAGSILAAILVFGVLFALFSPIMDAPDEAVHTGKAFLVAGGTLFNPKGGGMVSRAIIQVTIDTGGFTHNQTIVNTVLLGQPIQPGIVQHSDGAPQFFLNYLPAALAINVCQLLQTSVMTLLYAGRIINLAVYAVCVFFALKIAPRYKLFFGLAAAAPMAIYIAASYNGEFLTYGLSLLLAALFTRFCFRKGFAITYKQIIWFSVVCAAICMYKCYFLPLCLLPLIIPAERYASGRTKWIGLLICIMITAVAAFGVSAFQIYQINLDGGSSAVGSGVSEMGANALQQIHFVLHSVTSSGAILLRAFVANATDYIQWLFAFGWLSNSVPTIFVYLYVGFIALAGFVYSKYDYDENIVVETRHKTANKLGVLVILALAFCAVNLVMYLTWTPVGANYIIGPQGRYFIPLLLFLPFLSSNIRPQISEDDYVKKQNYILFTTQAFIILSVIQILFENY